LLEQPGLSWRTKGAKVQSRKEKKEN
jgi:hypothetical protein